MQYLNTSKNVCSDLYTYKFKTYKCTINSV